MDFFINETKQKTGLPVSINYGTAKDNAKKYALEVAFIDESETSEKNRLIAEVAKYGGYIKTNEEILKDESLDDKSKDEIRVENEKYKLAGAKIQREVRKFNFKPDGTEKNRDEILKEQDADMYMQLEKVVVAGADRDAFLASVKATLKGVSNYARLINGLLDEAQKSKEGK